MSKALNVKKGKEEILQSVKQEQLGWGTATGEKGNMLILKN